MKYAGVWKRFLALVIDWIILGVISWMLVLIVGGIFGISGAGLGSLSGDKDAVLGGAIIGIVLGMLLNFVVLFILSILYFVLMWKNSGATLGMKAVGIKVVDEESGNLPSGSQAFLRYLMGYFLPGIVPYVNFLAYILLAIMIGVDEKKQGWHDKIAKTYVIEA